MKIKLSRITRTILEMSYDSRILFVCPSVWKKMEKQIDAYVGDNRNFTDIISQLDTDELIKVAGVKNEKYVSAVFVDCCGGLKDRRGNPLFAPHKILPKSEGHLRYFSLPNPHVECIFGPAIISVAKAKLPKKYQTQEYQSFVLDLLIQNMDKYVPSM